MGFIEAFIMGVTQGLTEFLPVSSSGHLALIEHLFNFKPESLIFEVGVHLGTVLSIFTIYRKVIGTWLKDIFRFCRSFERNDGAYLFYLVLISAIPTGCVGLIFKSWIEMAFSNLLIVGASFIFTGFVLYWAEKKAANMDSDEVEPQAVLKNLGSLRDVRSISAKNAFFIGLAQAVAILPGVSRSGSTIAMGLFLGVSRRTAALFSFLMSIPVILGAGLLQLKGIDGLPELQVQYLLFSILVSYVFGLVGLLLILYVVKKAQLNRFSWYLWILGLSSITYYFTGG